jgi:hypothetical protein
VRIFLDPPDGGAESPAEALERCSAALTAITGRLAPRHHQSVWHCEAFVLRLWDPAVDGTAVSTEPHLFARMTFGDSLEDKWFVVGLLLQLSKEQRDVSVLARDSDGEFLLIEAAECIPRWLKPEIAENRVFLRHGALHIIPRPRTPTEEALVPPVQPLPLATALKALRSGVLRTRCAEASAVIVERTGALQDLGAARGPPRHPRRSYPPYGSCVSSYLP